MNAPSGWKHSPETRAKMRAARIGKRHSEASIAKMRAARIGKRLSPEMLEKVRTARVRPQVFCHPDRPHFAKGLCKSCYGKDYIKRNRKRISLRSLRWQVENPVKRFAIVNRYKYGLEPKDWEQMYNQQEGKCAICRDVKVLNVDHCHKSGKVRGLLCGNCNRALGLLRDSPLILGNAANYVSSRG